MQAPWTQASPQDRVPLYLTRPVPVDDYELRFDWLNRLTPGPSPEAMLQQWEPRQLIPLLYQTGYLTLTPAGDLAPPNREIATYLSRVLLDPWLSPDDKKRATLYQAQLVEALLHLRIPLMVAHFNHLLQLLPHQRFHGALRSAAHLVLDLAVLLSQNRIRYHEMEKSGLEGEADTVLGWDDIALVIEFKTGTQASATAGQRQIRKQGYLQAVPQVARLYLGLSLYAEDGRQVDAWSCQGYSLEGQPLGKSLTHQDTWPSDKAKLYQMWTVDGMETKPIGHR